MLVNIQDAGRGSNSHFRSWRRSGTWHSMLNYLRRKYNWIALFAMIVLTLLRSSRLNTRDLHCCRVCRNHSHSLSLGLPSYCRSPLALMGSWQLGYLSVIAHRSTCHIDLCGSFSGFSVRQGTLLWCPFGL